VLNGTSETRNEIETLKKLDKGHKHIVYHRDFWNGELNSCIVMELCRGNLADLQEMGAESLPKRLLLEIFSQITDGLEYLHKVAKLCHRDLKPENGRTPKIKLTPLVLFMGGSVPLFKIADFGISCTVTEAHANQTYQARGTEDYIAPEVRRKTFHLPADIWALGCMILYFTNGQLAMSEWTTYVRDELEKHKTKPTPEPPELLEMLPVLDEEYECFEDIIKKAVNLSATERPTATDLRAMLEGAIEAQSLKETIEDYRHMVPASLVRSEESFRRASEVDPGTPANFLRYCLGQDFANKHYLHHVSGLAVLFEDKHKINVLRGGWTALGYASFNEHTELVEILLDAGADVNATESDQATALHSACIHGYVEIVKLLLRHSPNLDLRDEDGKTALRIAVERAENGELVRMLLNANASVNIAANDGSTALHAVVSAEILRLILKKKPDLDIRDGSGWMPIHRLITRTSINATEIVEMTRLLLAAGADVTARYQYGWTNLHAAASTGNVELVKLLIQDSPSIDRQDGSLRTPINEAAAQNQSAVLKLLLDSGASAHIADADLNTPLHRASQHGHIAVVDLLLERDKSNEFVSAKNKDGWSALQLAILHGPHIEVIQRFVELQGDLNTPNGDFLDCLQLASQFNTVPVVQVLLDGGADLHAKGGWYGSALQIAARHGNLDVVKLFLDRGADVDAEGGWFGSAINAASSYDHSDVVELLGERSKSLTKEVAKDIDEDNMAIGELPGYLKHTKYASVVDTWSQASDNKGAGAEETTSNHPGNLPSQLKNYNSDELLSVGEGGLEVEFKASEGYDPAVSIRTDHPIPPSTQVYYFEVKVLSRGREGYPLHPIVADVDTSA
jgi:ankyrin repeat protein